MSKPCYLAIDGGGTHCRARIYDDQGAVLADGEAGPATLRFGLEDAWVSIEEATAKAARKIKLKADDWPSLNAGLGLAGLVGKPDRELVATYPHPFGKVTVATDAHTAVLGAFGGEEGGILILGTGSCGMAFSPEEGFHSIAGWGFPVSDAGGGARLGLAALRESLLVYEGLRPESTLAEELIEHFDGQPGKMMNWQYTADPHNYAAFAPVVFRHSEQGDHLATRLINELLDDAEMLARGILALGVDRICLRGGIGETIAPYMKQRLGNRLATARGDALDGALLMAQKPEQFAP